MGSQGCFCTAGADEETVAAPTQAESLRCILMDVETYARTYTMAYIMCTCMYVFWAIGHGSVSDWATSIQWMSHVAGAITHSELGGRRRRTHRRWGRWGQWGEGRELNQENEQWKCGDGCDWLMIDFFDQLSMKYRHVMPPTITMADQTDKKTQVLTRFVKRLNAWNILRSQEWARLNRFYRRLSRVRNVTYKRD